MSRTDGPNHEGCDIRRRKAMPNEEEKRIQEKQGGHHLPPRPSEGPPLDDTDRNTDKVIKPSRRKPEPYDR